MLHDLHKLSVLRGNLQFSCLLPITVTHCLNFSLYLLFHVNIWRNPFKIFFVSCRSTAWRSIGGTSGVNRVIRGISSSPFLHIPRDLACIYTWMSVGVFTRTPDVLYFPIPPPLVSMNNFFSGCSTCVEVCRPYFPDCKVGKIYFQFSLFWLFDAVDYKSEYDYSRGRRLATLFSFCGVFIYQSGFLQ